MDKVAGGSAMTSYLGTRLIQIEGDLAAELLDQERHSELTYLIGRHIGQLKARHQRLAPIFSGHLGDRLAEVPQAFPCPLPASHREVR